MMKAIITPAELMRNCMWTEYCEINGVNPQAVNEGLMEWDTEIVLTEKVCRKMGIKVELVNNTRE